MERILYAWSPTWAIDMWKRRNPSASRGESFALATTERGVRRLFAVDEKAAALGLFAGQKATDAAALVPGLVMAEADVAADRAALTALCDGCARFSPAVAPDPPDGLFLDISGVAHLWGGEAAMIDDLAARLAANGLTIRAAVAGSAGAAWALARFGPDRTVAPSGDAIDQLAPLPVSALRLTPEATAQIARLGLVTVARLAAVPREQILRRFGEDVVRRLDQAFGRAPEALAFRRPPNPWLARLALAEPISAPEDLARVAAELCGRLAARLDSESQGARRFELCFHRVDGLAPTLAVGLALPGRDAVQIVRLFQPLLERIDPGFGIEVATLAALAVEPLSRRQQRLDADLEIALEEGIAPMIDRLVGRLGEDAVWRADGFPSHAPERAVRRRPPLSRPTETGWDRERPRPLRLFRRPEPIEVVAPVPDDPPVFFRWRGRAHRVRRAEGPERLAEEWWRQSEGQPRDYYRVEDDAGARFWLFRAGLYDAQARPRWWMHGLFG